MPSNEDVAEVRKVKKKASRLDAYRPAQKITERRETAKLKKLAETAYTDHILSLLQTVRGHGAFRRTIEFSDNAALGLRMRLKKWWLRDATQGAIPRAE